MQKKSSAGTGLALCSIAAFIICFFCVTAYATAASHTNSNGVPTCNGIEMSTDEVCDHTDSNGNTTTYTYDQQAAYQASNASSTSGSLTGAIVAGIVGLLFAIGSSSASKRAKAQALAQAQRDAAARQQGLR